MGTKLTTRESGMLSEHEQTIEDGLFSFLSVGRALLAIREERLYKSSHDEFGAYCQSRWNMGRNYANKMIDAVEAADDVSEVETKVGTIVPTNEAVAREIAKIQSIPQRADVWEKAVETAPINKETGLPRVTASHVAKTRKALIPTEEDNGKPTVEDDEPEPLWQQFAAKHAEALKHLSQAIKAINWIEKHGEDAAYLSPVSTRIRTDYKALRGTITGNCPVGEKDGKISIKMLARK